MDARRTRVRSAGQGLAAFSRALLDPEQEPIQQGAQGERVRRVDLPAVMRALDDVRFSGWLVVELDAVPDNARTPRESAEINRRYLVDVLEQTL